MHDIVTALSASSAKTINLLDGRQGEHTIISDDDHFAWQNVPDSPVANGAKGTVFRRHTPLLGAFSHSSSQDKGSAAQSYLITLWLWFYDLLNSDNKPRVVGASSN